LTAEFAKNDRRERRVEPSLLEELEKDAECGSLAEKTHCVPAELA